MNVGWQRAKKNMLRGVRGAWLAVLALALPSIPAAVSAADDPSTRSYIKTSGAAFTVDGRPFAVANNHYLTYGSRARGRGA
jgi:hypothetical protein